ncbi:MAG: HIRAN domain-containing protein [Eggerthellaceae bacterium]|nr:HIRAN domain-containing protein [Eggerthellaceae bacterium]
MYEPSKLFKSFYVAGFRYYDGALVLDKLKPGTKLKLVPAPDNPFDPNAIELRYKKTKLGFVPRVDNGLLSVLAFYGHKAVFEARVLQVDPEAAPYEQVLVGVYVVDNR